MNNYSHNQIFIQNTYCSFLESKKNGILRLPVKRVRLRMTGATQAPNPGALGGAGQGVNKKQ